VAKKQSIWIVDDDEEMTAAIRLMLNLLNYEASSFLNARSVIQKLTSGTVPDLFLLDINMPEVSGLELLSYLRHREEWKHLPVIMLSNEATDVVKNRAMELGADGYLPKPVTVEEMEKVLNQTLQKPQKGFS
jgi:CheY-like chemotaxis protein